MFIVNMEDLNTNKWLKSAVVDMKATLDVLDSSMGPSSSRTGRGS
jgi:hypothetical protein